MWQEGRKRDAHILKQFTGSHTVKVFSNSSTLSTIGTFTLGFQSGFDPDPIRIGAFALNATSRGSFDPDRSRRSGLASKKHVHVTNRRNRTTKWSVGGEFYGRCSLMMAGTG